MNSFVVISSDLGKRVKYIDDLFVKRGIRNPHPDLLLFDDQAKLGVDKAKSIRRFLSIKPFQEQGRVVVLLSAQNLTQEAQNSLLKTLEEPPLGSLIVLGVEKEEDLLSTILSRCQIVRIKEEELRIKNEEKYFSVIEQLKNSTIEKRFEFIEKLEEKEQFLDALTAYFHQNLSKSKENLEFAKLLIDAHRWQKANVNIRAILEYLILNLPSF